MGPESGFKVLRLWTTKAYRCGRHCPVTAGQPTRMAEATFRRLCGAKRTAATDAICGGCHGLELPPELEIVEQSTMEHEMTTRSSWEGTCWVCGEKKTVRSTKGEDCCGSCEHIRRAAINNPKMLIEATRKINGDAYILHHLGVQAEADPAGELMEQIRENYNLEDIASIPAFIDNMFLSAETMDRLVKELGLQDQIAVFDVLQASAMESNESHRRAHAAETVIKDIRSMLSLQGDESILEAVAGMRREWQHAINICTDTLSSLGAEKGTNLNNIPQLAAELFDSKVRLYHQVADLEAIVDGEQLGAVRGQLDLVGGESIIDAVEKLKRERQQAVDIMYEVASEVGLGLGDIPDMPRIVSDLVAEMDIMRQAVDKPPVMLIEKRTVEPVAAVPPEYASLHRVLLAALNQAANGKGMERHAKDGEPFEQQKICEITRRVGLGYPLGQAIKKAEESIGLPIEAGIRENLGAINYLAAAVLIMEEQAAAIVPMDMAV